MIQTNNLYWDCECSPPHSYINKKSDRIYCPLCGAYEEDQPDSREDEVLQMQEINNNETD